MLNKILRRIRRIQVKIHYLRSKFDVVLQNKMPHIKINEKHEKSVKWVLRLLTIVGIISSVIAFSTWYYSLSFSIVLFLIEQIFEQIIFTHTIMLVQPLPQNWDGSKWTGMIMATNEKDLFLGFGFSDKSVGIDFFNTLFAWNDNGDINDDNIQLTLVQEDKENYSVHIYPTVQRTFVRENYKLHERNFDKRENAGKELNVFVTQICFCKVFPMSPTCAYNYLIGNNQDIYVQIFDTSRIKEDDPSTYGDVTLMDKRTILFKNITVCKRSVLDKEKNPMEYYNVPKY
jgi:hypothetical protein